MDLEAFWPTCMRGDWAPTGQMPMREPYAPAPLLRLLGCMELTVRLATYSGHDATSKLQKLTSQCHYALSFTKSVALACTPTMIGRSLRLTGHTWRTFAQVHPIFYWSPERVRTTL